MPASRCRTEGIEIKKEKKGRKEGIDDSRISSGLTCSILCRLFRASVHPSFFLNFRPGCFTRVLAFHARCSLLRLLKIDVDTRNS